MRGCIILIFARLILESTCAADPEPAAIEVTVERVKAGPIATGLHPYPGQEIGLSTVVAGHYPIGRADAGGWSNNSMMGGQVPAGNKQPIPASAFLYGIGEK